jgi:hypothetical protein
LRRPKGSGSQPTGGLRECATDPLKTPQADLMTSFTSANGGVVVDVLFTNPIVDINFFYCPPGMFITAPPNDDRVSCQ